MWILFVFVCVCRLAGLQTVGCCAVEAQIAPSRQVIGSAAPQKVHIAGQKEIKGKEREQGNKWHVILQHKFSLS